MQVRIYDCKGPVSNLSASNDHLFAKAWQTDLEKRL